MAVTGGRVGGQGREIIIINQRPSIIVSLAVKGEVRAKAVAAQARARTHTRIHGVVSRRTDGKRGRNGSFRTTDLQGGPADQGSGASKEKGQMRQIKEPK